MSKAEKMTVQEMKDLVREKQEELEYVAVPDTGEDRVVEHDEQRDVSGHEASISTHEGATQDAIIIREERSVGPQSAVEKLDDAIAVIEKLRTYYERIREAAIGVTQTEDWTNWGGKYRLNESGASKIMSQLGVREDTIENRKVTDTWGYTIYITKRYVPSWNPASSFDAVGSCRSDDPFVSVRKVFDKAKGHKVTKQIPAEEVDESNVLKAALANCRVNGLISVCGIKTVSVDELKAAPRVDITKIQEVSFGGGGGKKFKPSDKQVGFAKKLGASDDDVSKAKSYQDFQDLIDRLKSKPKQEEDF